MSVYSNLTEWRDSLCQIATTRAPKCCPAGSAAAGERISLSAPLEAVTPALQCLRSALILPQAAQLRDLNRRGDPEAVIRAFESGAAVSSEETLGEYVKALVKVDRLDSSSLLQTLQVICRLCWTFFRT